MYCIFVHALARDEGGPSAFAAVVAARYLLDLARVIDRSHSLFDPATSTHLSQPNSKHVLPLRQPAPATILRREDRSSRGRD